MYHLLDLLRRSKTVANLDIIAFADEQDVQFFHARAEIIDGSTLFVREFATADDSRYSYHWQTKNGALICRWDNAPHHKRIKTFPHHKHVRHKDNVIPSTETTLDAVLTLIERTLSTRR